ncbi:MAG: hypothetical protein ACOCQ1_00325 [Halanaerobiaceae bacterium]
MSSRYKYLLYDILMIIGIVLIIIGSIVLYLNQGGEKTTPTEKIDFSTSEFSLQTPNLEENEGDTVEIDISRGTSILEIADHLEEKGLIKARTFLWFIDKFDLDRSVRAGSYTFQRKADIEQIFAELILTEKGGVNDD